MKQWLHSYKEFHCSTLFNYKTSHYWKADTNTIDNQCSNQAFMNSIDFLLDYIKSPLFNVLCLVIDRD